jgi:hypothetical protein
LLSFFENKFRFGKIFPFSFISNGRIGNSNSDLINTQTIMNIVNK